MADKNVGGRDRLVRAVLAVVLSILAVRWLKGGKKGRGLLAGVGALSFGFNATTGYCGANDALDIDTTADEVPGASSDDDTAATPGATTDTDSVTPTLDTDEADVVDGRLTCAACGEPITVGQRRGPNAQDKIVHDDCA
jgi:hypothetical protein